MSKSNGKVRLSATDLEALKPITAGDFYWGHKHADKLADGSDDPSDLAVHVAHHAAVRAGLADEGDLYGFLDRIEFRELTSVIGALVTEEDTTGPLVEPTGS